jgi:hypothetical protein
MDIFEINLLNGEKVLLTSKIRRKKYLLFIYIPLGLLAVYGLIGFLGYIISFNYMPYFFIVGISIFVICALPFLVVVLLTRNFYKSLYKSIEICITNKRIIKIFKDKIKIISDLNSIKSETIIVNKIYKINELEFGNIIFTNNLGKHIKITGINNPIEFKNMIIEQLNKGIV